MSQTAPIPPSVQTLTVSTAPSQIAQAAQRGGIDPHLWGREGWDFIYYVLAGYDPATQKPEDIAAWINLLPKVLPCEKCRVNFADVLNKYPFEPYCLNDSCKTWYGNVRAEVARHEVPSPEKVARMAHQQEARASYWLATAGMVLIGAGVGFAVGSWMKRRDE